VLNSAVDKRAWLEPDHPELSLRQQCLLLGLNRSGLYYVPCTKPLSEEMLRGLRMIDEVYTQYPFFGTRQMASYLRTKGHEIKSEQVRGIYERLGLRSLAPGPHTSKPHAEHVIYPYLLRGVKIAEPDQVWSTDITYIRLHKGFAYLMAIMDWYSRYILDWELSISLEADFCIEALERVLQWGKCSIFNTDRTIYQ
jgi:putative transposase